MRKEFKRFSKIKTLISTLIIAVALSSGVCAAEKNDYVVEKEGEILVYYRSGEKFYEYNARRAEKDPAYKARGPIEVDPSEANYFNIYDYSAKPPYGEGDLAGPNEHSTNVCVTVKYSDGIRVDCMGFLDYIETLDEFCSNTELLIPMRDNIGAAIKITDNNGETKFVGKSRHDDLEVERSLYDFADNIIHLKLDSVNNNFESFNFMEEVSEYRDFRLDHVDSYGRVYDQYGNEYEYGKDDVIDVNGNIIGKAVCKAYATRDIHYNKNIHKGDYLGDVEVYDYPKMVYTDEDECNKKLGMEFAEFESSLIGLDMCVTDGGYVKMYDWSEDGDKIYKEICDYAFEIRTRKDGTEYEFGKEVEGTESDVFGRVETLVYDLDGNEIGYLDAQGIAYNKDNEKIGYCKWYNFEVSDWPDDWIYEDKTYNETGKYVGEKERDWSVWGGTQLYLDADYNIVDTDKYEGDAEFNEWLFITKNSNLLAETYGDGYLINIEPYEAEIVEEPFTDDNTLHVKVKTRKIDESKELDINKINSLTRDMLENRSVYDKKELNNLFTVKARIHYYHDGKEYEGRRPYYGGYYDEPYWEFEREVKQLDDVNDIDLAFSLKDPYHGNIVLPEVGDQFKVELEVKYNDCLKAYYLAGTDIKKDNETIKMCDEVTLSSVNTTYKPSSKKDNYEYIQQLAKDIDINASFDSSRIRVDVDLKAGAKSEMKYIKVDGMSGKCFVPKIRYSNSNLMYSKVSNSVAKRSTGLTAIIDTNPDEYKYTPGDKSYVDQYSDKWENMQCYINNVNNYFYVPVDISYGGVESEYNDMFRLYNGSRYTLEAVLKAYFNSKAEVYRVEVYGPGIRDTSDISSALYLTNFDQNPSGIYESIDTSANKYRDIKYNSDILNTPSVNADNVIPSNLAADRKKAGITGDKVATKIVNKTISLKSVKRNKSKKAITIKWSKQKNVESYDVYMATSKTGKYTKVATIKGSKTKATIKKFNGKKLSPKKNYWVTVVAHSTKGTASKKFKTYTTKNSGKKAYTIKKIKGLK